MIYLINWDLSRGDYSCDPRNMSDVIQIKDLGQRYSPWPPDFSMSRRESDQSLEWAPVHSGHMCIDDLGDGRERRARAYPHGGASVHNPIPQPAWIPAVSLKHAK